MRILPTFIFWLIFILGFGSINTVQGQQSNSREAQYKVVINHEEQYAIWLSAEPLKRAWKDTGISGNRAECQEYIEEVWTDMRPLSIRKLQIPENTGYSVIINHEEQYAVWPGNLDLPKGWRPAGMKGSLQKCSDYIRMEWTDMRPLSQRKAIDRRRN